MKKLILVTLLSGLVGSSIASAASVDLATGRLLFRGALNASGCTANGASSDLGDIYVDMPGSLGVGKVKVLEANTVEAFDKLDSDVKYSNLAKDFSLAVNCPTPDVYGYIADMLLEADPASTLDADDVKTAFPTSAKLYFFESGSSGFIKTADSGSAVGLLAADASARNTSVGIAVLHKNSGASGNLAKLVDLTTDSVDVTNGLALQWTESGNVISANPVFDFAYVPASSVDGSVKGGQTYATLPFKFQYR